MLHFPSICEGNSAAVGAICGAVIVLGRRTIFVHGWTPDWFKAALMLVTLAILLSKRKIPEQFIIIAAAIIGLIAYPLVK